MNDLLLIVTLAGERVACLAGHVESVVEIESVTPAPGTARHVAGLSALRSRVLTVIDCIAALDLGCALTDGVREAIVVELDGHPYALLVDEVEDVIAFSGVIQPLRAAPSAGWARVARGMVEADGRLLLLVDPAALVEGRLADAA